jgi:DnaJ-class molecular chaperone
MSVTYPNIPKSATLALSQALDSTPKGTPDPSEEKYLDGDSDDLLKDLKDAPSDKKVEEVARILSWPEFACYEILGVPEDEGDDKNMKRQYRRIATLTHTDKNNDPQAEKAFKRKFKIHDILPKFLTLNM